MACWFLAKKLAFKDPPSLKFHDRTDINVELGEVWPHIMKILFAVSQKCPKQVVSLEFWGSFYSSSNSFILSPKLRAKVLLSQYILWPCLFLLPYLRFTKALISSHLYQIRGSVGTIGHVHIRYHFVLRFLWGISIQNIYMYIFIKIRRLFI